MGDSDDGLVLLVTGCVDLACCFGVKRGGSCRLWEILMMVLFC